MLSLIPTSLGQQPQRTRSSSAREQGTNPEFRARFLAEVRNREQTHIHFRLLDQDSISHADREIGQAVLPLVDVLGESWAAVRAIALRPMDRTNAQAWAAISKTRLHVAVISEGILGRVKNEEQIQRAWDAPLPSGKSKRMAGGRHDHARTRRQVILQGPEKVDMEIGKVMKAELYHRRTLVHGRRGDGLNCKADFKGADKAVVMLAVSKSGEALQYAAKKLTGDKDVVLAAVRQRGTALQFAAKKLRADREVADRDVVEAAVAKSGCALRHASFCMKADKEVVMTAVANYGGAIDYASAALQRDKDVILAAVKQSSLALCKESIAQSADKEVILACINFHGEGLHYASQELQADKEVVLAAVKKDGWELRFAAPELRADKEVVLAAVRQRGLALAHCAKELQHDKEVVLAAMSQNGWELRYVPAAMKDKEVVLTAMAPNGDALHMAPEELRKNRDVVLTAVRQHGHALGKASVELRSDRDLVLAAVMQDGRALEYAAAELQEDEAIVFAAGRQNGLAFNHAATKFFGAPLWQEAQPFLQNLWVFRVSRLSGAFCYVVAKSDYTSERILRDVARKLGIVWWTGCHDSDDKFELLRDSTRLRLYKAHVSWWNLPESEKGTIIDLKLLVKV
ncbi:unnamed protein product [Durusdinium trenchii]|uniref:C2 domain-containing protein n=1 Tax=Durusdinium trenchii TaxID=1381693 RepID=A0ABP0PI88_9DINO